MRTYIIKIKDGKCELDKELYHDFEKEANYFLKKIEKNIDKLKKEDLDKILADAFHKSFVKIDCHEIGWGSSDNVMLFVGYITLSYTEDEN